MHLPQKGKIEWNLNTLVTLGGVFVGLVVTSTGWGITYADMRNDNEDLRGQITDINARFAAEAADRKERLRIYQATLDGMQNKIGEITPLSLNLQRAAEQGAENKMAVVKTNERIDRVVESFGGKLDSVTEGIAKLNTAVQVLSSKLDDIQNRPDKSIFKLRTIKP